MKDKSKKQAITLSVVAVTTLIALVASATYAYFKAQGGDTTSTNLNVTTYTTDVFTFAVGDKINLEVTQSNFASGKGNAVGNTFASATLTANNKTNTATEHYYLYLNIENNDFEYTVNDTTPELMLTITDNKGNEVTDIAGLTHTSVTDAKGTTISGYDITTKSGLLKLFNNREITTTSKKEEKWNITITFVNYDADQTKNANKTLSAKVMIQKEKIVQTVANICKNGQSLSSCIISMNGIDDTLYHHNGTIKSESEYSVTILGSELTKTYEAGTILDANDGSYRYSGGTDVVNNYVCFGSNEDTCPESSLYRIIGVFNDKTVKLIKATYAKSDLLGTDGAAYNDDQYYWYGPNSKSNIWNYSLLNSYNLYRNYFRGVLDKTWQNKIIRNRWSVGGNTADSLMDSIPSEIYQNEVVSPITDITGGGYFDWMIGLPYISDFYFAANKEIWLLPPSSHEYIRNYKDNYQKPEGLRYSVINWLFNPEMYFITRFSESTVGAYYFDAGEGLHLTRSDDMPKLIYPTFYLNPDVTFVSGSGTSTDPIRIS